MIRPPSLETLPPGKKDKREGGKKGTKSAADKNIFEPIPTQT